MPQELSDQPVMKALEEFLTKIHANTSVASRSGVSPGEWKIVQALAAIRMHAEFNGMSWTRILAAGGAAFSGVPSGEFLKSVEETLEKFPPVLSHEQQQGDV